MNQVSKLFDSRSKEYGQIYGDLNPKKLLHQEKRVRAALVEDLVVNYSLPIEGGVIVDSGCGMGNVLLNAKNRGVKAEMHGLDISNEMISLANKSLNLTGSKGINFRTGTLEDAPGCADIVLSLGVLGYQKRQEEFLVGLSNIVVSGGYLIFTTANGDSLTRLARRYLSKIHSTFKGNIKSRGVEFLSITDKQVEKILVMHGFKCKKRLYITFGLGLFASSIECSVDRLFFKYFSGGVIGKFLSLTVIYVYKKIDE
jgi:2-polyprenyl-3-methyl-5-hydroxy-6-metoxy-1,4-benzoquinol methylase